MNNGKKVDATLETRLSKTSGNTYQCVVIKLTDTYEKVVFLEKAELALLNMVKQEEQQSDFFARV